ncbi:formate dehydrogenase accessory protein FdhE [Desulfovibrio sp. UCD-KL4C]|uniref:formate dehydrogenase accessory protein FdhE n=1 Tax=Desulfovibrio sp. UCD-KL4C TaxID=2578120 RepID=UPI0025C6B3A3|nr:formate dehydrogenase accessory protein FdhE [Desulfovibrio sp. UCD-KL4C]
MEITSELNQIESTLENIKNRDASYGDLVGRFGSLFKKIDQVRTHLTTLKLHSPVIEATRLAAGVPIFAEADLYYWSDAFKQSDESLLPVIAEVLELEPEIHRNLLSYMDVTENLLGLAQASIDGNMNHFENVSAQLGITTPAMLHYISDTISAPVLNAIKCSMGKDLSLISWEHSYCPVCGSSPSISQLSPKDMANSEYLIGGGGKKYLHCSLCGHDWHHKRNSCAACGNDDSETREFLFLDNVERERIEICHKCGKYMINIDMREYTSLPHLDTIQMGLIHLDVLAHERNLAPISPTLWNSIT